MRDWTTRGLLLTHLLSVVGEWAAIIGILVHAFAWGGPRVVGIISLVMLTPALLSATFVGAAQARWRTHAIRVCALTGQVGLFTGAAVAAYFDASTPIVALFVVAGLSALMLVPPTTAALLPHVAESTDGLVRANLWVTYCDSASGLIGPLVAGVIVGVGGVPAVFAAGAAGAAVGLIATTWRASGNVRAARSGVIAEPKGAVRRTMAGLRSHPWGRGVVLLLSARNLMLGSLDVLLVIVALEALGMGEGGPGYLGALVGAGALASTLVTTVIVRRAKLRASLMFAVVVSAVSAVALGMRIERPIVFVVLPVIGVAVALIDAVSRTLLLRSTDPRSLAPLYASLAVIAGLGQMVGSIIAQVMLVIGDTRLAFITLGGVLVVLAVFSIRSLRRADENADIPVIEMTLLSSLPMLSALPTDALERVARTVETISVNAGDVVMSASEEVDGCYVIAEGDFDVEAKGGRLGQLSRGDVVGEAALLSKVAPSTSVSARTSGKVLRIQRDSFLVALTGHSLDGAIAPTDLDEARDRFRTVVAARERFEDAGSGRADLWLGLGATGRTLGEPTYTDSLARSAALAEGSRNKVALAEAAALATWPGAFFFIADNPDQKMISLCENALEGLDDDDPMRVRVLATLASNLAFADSMKRRRQIIDEAHALAAGHHDLRLEAAVLNSEFISMWEPATLDRREAIGPQLSEIGKQVDDEELHYLGRFFDAFCTTERGLLDRARTELLALRDLAPVIQNPYFEFLSERLLLSIDIAQGRADVRERIDALATRHANTYADTDGTWALQVGGLTYEAGLLGTMVPTLSEMLEGPHARTWLGALALAHVQGGDQAAAAAVIAEHEDIPRSYFWLTSKQTQAEVLANLKDTDRCAELFEELMPFRGQIGVTASGSRLFGLVSRSLGELALALGRYDEAINLLEEAVEFADGAAMPFESTMSRRLLAQTLEAIQAEPRAQQLIAEALPVAAERGYDREAALLRALMA